MVEALRIQQLIARLVDLSKSRRFDCCCARWHPNADSLKILSFRGSTVKATSMVIPNCIEAQRNDAMKASHLNEGVEQDTVLAVLSFR